MIYLCGSCWEDPSVKPQKPSQLFLHPSCWISRTFFLCPSCENVSSELCRVQPGLTGFTPVGHVKASSGGVATPRPLTRLVGIVSLRGPSHQHGGGGGGVTALPLASLSEPTRCRSIKRRMLCFQETFTFKITDHTGEKKWLTGCDATCGLIRKSDEFLL